MEIIIVIAVIVVLIVIFSNKDKIGIGSNPNIEKLRLAKNSLQAVQIKYVNKSGTFRDRTICIYGLGSSYVDAYDSYRGTTRTFRISRIRSVTLTNTSYTIPSSYSPSEWV